jgi:hypothetical protein
MTDAARVSRIALAAPAVAPGIVVAAGEPRHKDVVTTKARSRMTELPASLAFTQLAGKVLYDLFHGGKSI